MTTPTTENKQYICTLLCTALKATRDQHDLKSLTYQETGPDTSRVIATWESGSQRINTSMDSGIAMIREILRAIS